MDRTQINLKNFFLTFFFILISACLSHAEIHPEPVDGTNAQTWMQRHRSYVEQTRKNKTDLLFLGDSITDFWRGDGFAFWQKKIEPMNAANFGIGGDRIEHLWWRIMNGELDAIHPKYVFVLIGTNNLLFHEANEIIDGHQKLLTELRKRLPDAQIIVFGIFPRVDSWSKHVHDRIPPINQALQNFSAQTSLHYFDLKKLFLDPETGNVPTSIMYDGLHLTSKGYQLWGEEILRILKTLEPFST